MKVKKKILKKKCALNFALNRPVINFCQGQDFLDWKFLAEQE